eukprot:TRINITY_DN14946_c0_g1_i1.p1 TRINITY_DN14946_c0_g1~~TRINITY_DN14946_c0_g1_i1.p1  ORF type:complete len:115 (+),score=12.98 TRINITY_DN14946_c0_g1_i1:209-553(+)
MIRKKGKLPGETYSEKYDQAYASGNEMEIVTNPYPKEKFPNGFNVVCVDDFISSGGSLICAIKLLNRVQATVVGAVSMCEYPLGGRDKIRANYNIEVFSVLQYSSVQELSLIHI